MTSFVFSNIFISSLIMEHSKSKLEDLYSRLSLEDEGEGGSSSEKRRGKEIKKVSFW